MNPVRSHARDKVASPEDLGGATSYGMNKSRIIYSIAILLFGAFMFVYGEVDDSPGGQLLGLLAVVIGIVGVIKSKKKKLVKLPPRSAEVFLLVRLVQ